MDPAYVKLIQRIDQIQTGLRVGDESAAGEANKLIQEASESMTGRDAILEGYKLLILSMDRIESKQCCGSCTHWKMQDEDRGHCDLPACGDRSRNCVHWPTVFDDSWCTEWKGQDESKEIP